MQKRSDDRLIAYLDGEVDVSERREIEAWLDSDPAARDKLASLAKSAALVRSAFDEIMREPLPDRLIAAARGETVSVEPSAIIVPFRRGQEGGGAPTARSWWLGLPLAASLFGLLLAAPSLI
jgi:anti-sigma factor RsiW